MLGAVHSGRIRDGSSSILRPSFPPWILPGVEWGGARRREDQPIHYLLLRSEPLNYREAWAQGIESIDLVKSERGLFIPARERVPLPEGARKKSCGLCLGRG